MSDKPNKPTAHVIALGRARVAPLGGRMKGYQNVVALRFENLDDFKRAVKEGVLRFKGEETGMSKDEIIEQLNEILAYLHVDTGSFQDHNFVAVTDVETKLLQLIKKAKGTR